MVSIFVTCLGNLCLSQGYEDILLFSSTGLTVTAFTFRSMVPLELVSVYVVRLRLASSYELVCLYVQLGNW